MDREKREPDRSPEEIRYEIERTRSSLDETVEAIGDRLSPGRFVDELWMRVQSEGASAVTHTLREHPMPFMLVGAGLSWLVYERARNRPRRSDGGMARRPGDRAATAARHAGDSVRDASSRLKHSASEAAHAVGEASRSVQEKAAAATDTVASKLSDAADTAKESVAGAAETAVREVRHGAERAREGVWQMFERNPMAIGALALGIGMAGGLSAPRTRWENERFGKYAKPLKEETKQVVEEAAEKAKGVAQEALEAGGRTAVETAKRGGAAEGLTTEGMRDAAARAREQSGEGGEG